VRWRFTQTADQRRDKAIVGRSRMERVNDYPTAAPLVVQSVVSGPVVFSSAFIRTADQARGQVRGLPVMSAELRRKTFDCMK